MNTKTVQFLTDISAALLALASDGERLRAAAGTALHASETPGTDPAVTVAVDAYSDAMGRVIVSYALAAQHIEREHGGALWTEESTIPITPADLMIEGKIAHAMPSAWQARQAKVWAEIAGLVT